MRARRPANIITIGTILAGATCAVAQQKAPWSMPPDDFGGAVFVNAKTWIGPDDYPASALRKNEQGFVVISFDIAVDGHVGNCTVARSSGYAELDSLPCRLLVRRARFEPARNAQGTPVATKGSKSVPFSLP